MKNYIKKCVKVIIAVTMVLSFTIVSYAQSSKWEENVNVKEATITHKTAKEGISKVEGVARGRIISSVLVELANLGKGTAQIYAEELCHVEVDKIKMVLTLEERNEETGEWEKVYRYEDEWLAENEPDGKLTMKMVSMNVYGLEQGKYYRVRGIFGGYQDSLQEAWSAKTDAVYID